MLTPNYQLLHRLASRDSGWRLHAPAYDGWKDWWIQRGEGEGAHAIVIHVEHRDNPCAMPFFTAELYLLLDDEWKSQRVLWTEHRRPEKGEQENIIAAFLEGPIRRAMRMLAA